MADPKGGAEIEIVRVVFRSWEHRWQTGGYGQPSIATAQRLLPDNMTAPIYHILLRSERELLRDTLPFSPYGLRLRLKNSATANVCDPDRLSEMCEAEHGLNLGLSEVCPGWDAAMPQPIATRYGELLRAPAGDAAIRNHYSLEVRSAVFDDDVRIDDLLGRFSHRFVPKSPYGF